MIEVDTSVAFKRCVMAAFGSADYVAQWERLRGLKLVILRDTSPIGRMIDAALNLPTLDDEAARLFVADVKDLIFDRLDEQAIFELSLESEEAL